MSTSEPHAQPATREVSARREKALARKGFSWDHWKFVPPEVVRCAICDVDDVEPLYDANLSPGPIVRCRDVVTSLQVFEHVDEPPAELAKIRRVLKPGGLLVVEIPSIHSPLVRVMRSRHRHFVRDPGLVIARKPGAQSADG